jgi:hypothetical protein
LIFIDWIRNQNRKKLDLLKYTHPLKSFFLQLKISGITRNSLKMGRRPATFKKCIYYNLNSCDDPNATRGVSRAAEPPPPTRNRNT